MHVCLFIIIDASSVSVHVCLVIIIVASSAHEEARKVYKRQGRVRAALPLPRCHVATTFALLSTVMSYASSIQSGRELCIFNSIQESFRNEVPNVGLLVKVISNRGRSK